MYVHRPFHRWISHSLSKEKGAIAYPILFQGEKVQLPFHSHSRRKGTIFSLLENVAKRAKCHLVCEWHQSLREAKLLKNLRGLQLFFGQILSGEWRYSPYNFPGIYLGVI